MSFTGLLLSAGPSSVQYQHATPVLYQAQSGSPPATGLPRVSLSASQQGPTGHATVPLAPGIPQQQQVTPSHTLFPVLIRSMSESPGIDFACRWLFRFRKSSWRVEHKDRAAFCPLQEVTGSSGSNWALTMPSLTGDSLRSITRCEGPDCINGPCISSIFFTVLTLTCFGFPFVIVTCVSLYCTKLIFLSLFVTRCLYVTAGQDTNLC